MLDELITYITGFGDVWFGTHLDVAEEYKRNQVAQGTWDAAAGVPAQSLSP
jgi:hypothetical protein